MLARYIHLVEDGTIIFPSYLMSSNIFWIASSNYSRSVIYSTEKLGVKAQLYKLYHIALTISTLPSDDNYKIHTIPHCADRNCRC